MKLVLYTVPALKQLKTHETIRTRIMKAITEYAEDQNAYAKQVAQLVGSSAKRLRVGDFRVIPTGVNDDSSFTPVGMRAGRRGQRFHRREASVEWPRRVAGRPRAKERLLYQRSFFMTVGISFEETADKIIVAKIGPRGNVYD